MSRRKEERQTHAEVDSVDGAESFPHFRLPRFSYILQQ